jgi:MarR family transcriptional regulator, 2-MHQ and catechol-resistance regulon repressor
MRRDALTTMPNPRTDPVLKVLRPLSEAYWAFWSTDREHLRTLKLTVPQFDVLATLGDTDGMTCRELAAETLVTKGTLTVVLDGLEARGLLERQDVAEDRRHTRVRLTSKGNALFRKVFPAHVAHLKPFFDRALTPQEADVLTQLLVRLRNSFMRQ